jgi:transposase-like protein
MVEAMEFVVLIVWLVLCGAVAVYAENKGRSGVGFFFLSLFLSPLVGLVVALAVRPDERRVAAAQGMKRCPECAEFVQPEAKICRFCQHKFTEAEQLAAAGMSAGPPCPKCGSISTLSHWERVESSRWWKKAQAPFLRCRQCGEKWQPENSAPVERVAESVTLAGLIAVLCLVTLVAVAIARVLSR